MATLEERLAGLEGDYAVTIQGITVKLDEHMDLLREQGKDIREIRVRLATVDTRLNRIDERFDVFREEVNQKLEQIIMLLTQGK